MGRQGPRARRVLLTDALVQAVRVARRDGQLEPLLQNLRHPPVQLLLLAGRQLLRSGPAALRAQHRLPVVRKLENILAGVRLVAPVTGPSAPRCQRAKPPPSSMRTAVYAYGCRCTYRYPPFKPQIGLAINHYKYPLHISAMVSTTFELGQAEQVRILSALITASAPVGTALVVQ